MRGNEMIERRIEISEAEFKSFKKYFYWLAMMSTVRDSYIYGYVTGIIAAFQALGLFDLLKVNEDAKRNPVNLLNEIRDSEVIR